MDMQALKAMVERHEGRRPFMYRDSCGIATVGVGHNLVAKSISDAAIDQILTDDLNEVIAYAQKQTWWPFVENDAVRQMAILDMLFQLGSFTGFPKALNCLKTGNWNGFADNMTYSNPESSIRILTGWFKQSGTRATEIMGMIRRGTV
jgi:GH24 family phage-related lysozyme (muramidase)